MAEDGAPAQEFLNQALKEDAPDDSYVCNANFGPRVMLLIRLDPAYLHLLRVRSH